MEQGLVKAQLEAAADAVRERECVEELKQVQFFSPPMEEMLECEDGGSGKEFVDEETGEEDDIGDPGHPPLRLVTCEDLVEGDSNGCDMPPEKVAWLWKCIKDNWMS